MREIANLFITFAKMGCITFGGGYAMLPIIERELIQKRGWTNMEDVMRYYTISQVTPGIIAVNVSTFIGYKRCGIAGGIAATLGFVFPSVTLIMIIAATLRSFTNITLVQHCFNGVRLAVGALVLETSIKLITQLLKKNPTPPQKTAAVLICIASFLTSVIWSTNPVFIILAAGIAGFCLPTKRNPS